MLEALFENPFLIIILIGIISSMFGKSKPTEEERKKRQQQQQQRQRAEQQQQQQQQQRPQPVRTQQAQPQQPREQRQRSPFEGMWREQEAHPTKQEINRNIEAELRKRREIQEKKIRELHMQQEAVEAAARRLRPVRKIETPVQLEKEEKVPGPLLPSYGSQIVDGIVLAEILGKPRSKDPYRSRRF